MMATHPRNRQREIEGWCQNCGKEIELAGDARRYKLANFSRFIYVLLLCRKCDQVATIQKFRSYAEFWLDQMHSRWENRHASD
jgi:hypothetical protein